jgi:hypothetical protein
MHMRSSIVIVSALLLCALMPPNPQPVYTLQSTGDPVVFQVPAHDVALGPEQAIATQVTVDLQFDYAVVNNGTAPAFVQVCAPGSTQIVEIVLDDGTPVGYATFPLVPIGVVVQPGATFGPAFVVMKDLAFTWQTHLGNLPATEGPAGSSIKLLALFPSQIMTSINGCRVRKMLSLTARVHVNIS